MFTPQSITEASDYQTYRVTQPPRVDEHTLPHREVGVHHSKIGSQSSATGQNPNASRTLACQLLPAADIRVPTNNISNPTRKRCSRLYSAAVFIFAPTGTPAPGRGGQASDARSHSRICAGGDHLRLKRAHLRASAIGCKNRVGCVHNPSYMALRNLLGPPHCA